MRFYWLLFLILICTFTRKAYSLASINMNLPYYEVRLTYPNLINGKRYMEEADLLRNKRWLIENKINKVGDPVILSFPEFGIINAKAAVTKLTKVNLNPTISSRGGNHMVTGKFVHYATDVRAYQLKNFKTGYMQTIKATPNHAFYVKNRLAYNRYLHQYSHFIEIQNITSKDILINENGNEVKLVCNSTYSCGRELIVNKNNPILVYNLEVYNKHQYLVTTAQNSQNFQEMVLVHNMYNDEPPAETPPPIPPRKISNYKIGSGDFGDIYKMGNNKVVKIFSDRSGHDEFTLEHLKNSAALFSKVNDDLAPAIVAKLQDYPELYSIERIRRFSFPNVYELPYIEGQTLYDINKAKFPEDINKVRENYNNLRNEFINMLDKGIIHGDLQNPRNIIFEPTSHRFRFVDFDKARTITNPEVEIPKEIERQYNQLIFKIENIFPNPHDYLLSYPLER